MESAAKIADILMDGEEFNVIYHINPDGDAVGSAYALALALRLAGKKANAVCSFPVPQAYRYLTDQVDVMHLNDPEYICVDTSTRDRLGEYGSHRILCAIDHHENNTTQARHLFCDPSASCCAQLVYEVIQELGVPVSRLMAEFLMTGLVTDTSCFRSNSTDKDSMRYAYIFASCGADIKDITRRHYLLKSDKRQAIELRLRESKVRSADGLTAVYTLANSVYEELGITDDDTEGINDVCEENTGTVMGIVIREKVRGRCRISVRCTGRYNADEFCASFGGGGHHNAAGATIEGSAEEVRKLLMSAAEDHIRKKNSL
ncbi:MAG: DHH family phosphoesterase [Oscillospiraceae bacterium]|nr:DHH family phosphoesterase [Oscillospiraceae bacterium]